MNLEEARNIVYTKKKNFKKFVDTYGSKYWPQVANDYYNFSFKENERTTELISVLEDCLLPLLGKEKAEIAKRTLQQTGFVSTCDHSGVLCHPFFLNSSIVRNNTNLESILTFSCGGVSLTNSSYPRGIFFHNNSGNTIRLPFISLKGRRRSVYGHSPFTKDGFAKIINKIDSLTILERQKNILSKLLKKIFTKENIFDQDTYGKQLTIINDLLWEELFKKDSKPLVYIEVEEIVKELLLQVHLKADTLISKILFEKTTRENYVKYFDGVVGAHNTNTDSGSHIFWYIDNQKDTRVQLFLEGEKLKSKDNSITINLTREDIIKGLSNYSLLPSMAFCYGMLASYYKLTLGGGFSQIDYLEKIVEAWEKTTGEISQTTTNIFSGEFVLASVYNEINTWSASSIDLLLYTGDEETDYLVNTPTVEVALQEALNTQTIGETIDAMMDEFMEIITGVKPKITNIKIHKTFHV